MVNLDYFYGSEGEQYRFYQIPAILLEDEEYKKISDTAKLLYGILLSRLALSKKNNWIEKETNRVYILYNRNDIAQKILKTENVAYIKELGRLISNYNENYWNGIRQIIVFEGLMAKFSQNESLKRQLQETEHCILAECAVKDKIWGIGLSMGDPDRLEISKWKGQNLLGYTLMMVRDWL